MSADNVLLVFEIDEHTYHAFDCSMSNFIESEIPHAPKGVPVFVAASLRDAIEAANEEVSHGYYEYGYEVLFKKL